MDQPKDLFSPKPIFIGFTLSGLYGVLSAIILSRLGCADFDEYVLAYFVTFNSAISGGLVFATALTVWRTQDHVQKLIESTFSEQVLERVQYDKHRRAFNSRWRTLSFSCLFAIVAFAIFWNAGFPFNFSTELSLIIAGCLQYAAGVYIGRKIFHIARMIRSLSHAPIRASLFTEDRLAGISPYVTYISILTAAAVYVGVTSYYGAHFSYDGVGGAAMRASMLFPAIIAVPVLIFAYSPRVVIRRVYEKAIEAILRKLKNQGKKDNLSEFHLQTQIIELRKTLYDELNSRLKTTLEDIPMVIVLGVTLLSVIKS